MFSGGVEKDQWHEMIKKWFKVTVLDFLEKFSLCLKWGVFAQKLYLVFS